VDSFFKYATNKSGINMKIIVNNIKLSLNDDINILKEKTAKKLKLTSKDINDFRIVKESIDARKKNNINFIYSTTVEIDNKYKLQTDNDIKILEYEKEDSLKPGNKEINQRPAIIGSGPAGLFAALMLSENGYKPLIIERGECVEKRTETVNQYWKNNILNTESNVQFGEGGAGTFSDGKLTTRINDPRCEKVLEEFHKSGIEKEILYKAKPHIGTDKLKDTIINIRKRIIENGGEFRFNTKLTSLKIDSGKLTGIVLSNNENFAANVVVLAVGHSSRDTFESLYSSGVTLLQKPFSMGVRIEHLQEMIDRAQFGTAAGHPKLGAAEYHLFYKTGDRTVYSFCMCPGGLVVAAASENETIVTNGMSEFARNQKNANSAWVVSVTPEDFGSTHPLSGVELQRKLEKLAFKIGGNNNSAPIQRLGDFLANKETVKPGIIKPGYTGKTQVADLNQGLPDFIKNPLKESIKYFDGKLHGFGMSDAILTGFETRTSSPVRILRDDSFQAVNVEGLFPCGEGAGYAGGIVSAAVDGMRVAEQIIKTYKPVS
jgi:uncharacterized protein